MRLLKKNYAVYCMMSFPHSDFGTQTNHGNPWPTGPARIWFSWWISMDFQWNPRRKLSCLPSSNQTWQWQVVFFYHEHQHFSNIMWCFPLFSMLFFKGTPTFNGSILHFKGLLRSPKWPHRLPVALVFEFSGHLSQGPDPARCTEVVEFTKKHWDEWVTSCFENTAGSTIVL